MKATLLAKSSSGDPHKVEFSAVESTLRIFCHCQAGVLHRMCKHKQALIDGDVSILYDSNQAALLSEIHSWPQFNNLKKEFENFTAELAKIEKAVLELDKKEKTIKARMGRGLSFGFES